MPPCLTLSIIRYGSRVKWSNPGKGVAPSPTPWCSKLSKREPSGHPRLWSPTLLTYLTKPNQTKPSFNQFFSHKYSYLIVICVHTVIWFQVFLFNANNLRTIIFFQVFQAIRWFKTFGSDKNLDDQARSGRRKTVDTETVLQAIEANPASNPPRVSGNHVISQSCVVGFFHDLSKRIWSCWILTHVTKILQNFWFTLVIIILW